MFEYAADQSNFRTLKNVIYQEKSEWQSLFLACR